MSKCAPRVCGSVSRIKDGYNIQFDIFDDNNITHVYQVTHFGGIKTN